MLEYVLMGILALVVLFYLHCVYLPAKKMSQMKATYEKLGYKVYMYDYKPMKASLAVQRELDIKDHGDALYTVKTKWSQADIVIWNLLNAPIVELVNVELIKEFLSPNHPYNYEKLNAFMGNLRRVMGRGIVFSEGAAWKQKRKLISGVFNHQFIKSNIPRSSR